MYAGVAMAVDTPEDRAWWGTYAIESGQAAVFRIGPLEIAIARRDFEWKILSSVLGDPLDPSLRRSVPGALPGILSDTQVERFVAAETESALGLMPVCADLPVVVRPGHPLSVLPRESVTLYVSSPLWLRVELGESKTTLTEMAFYPPSETWFGPSTTDGEVCYATQVIGRLRAEDFPYRPHRAITCIEIANRTPQLMRFDRLSLPVPSLSLYTNESGQLWTEAVSLERVPDQELARFETTAAPPRSAGPTERVAGPRRSGKNPLVRAFASLFRT